MTTLRWTQPHTPPGYVTDLDRCGAEVRASCRRGDFTDAVEIIRARLTYEGHPVPPVEARVAPVVVAAPVPPEPVVIGARSVLAAGLRTLGATARRLAS